MSQQFVPLLALTFTTPAAAQVKARRAVKFDGAQAGVQGEKVAGVAQYDGDAGQAYAATVKGTAIVEIGAAVARGASLIVDAQGRAITATAAPGEFVFADALEAGAAAGHFIEALLR